MCLVVIIVVAAGFFIFSLSGSLFLSPSSSSSYSSSPHLRSRICLASTADSYTWSLALVYLTFSFIGCRPFPRTLYLCLTACAAVVCGLRSAPRVIATAYLELLSYILGELLQSYRRCIHSIRFAREASVLTPAPIVVIAQLEQLGGEVEYRELHHRTSATPLQSPLPSPLPIPRLSRTTKLFQYPTSVFLHEPTKLRRSIQYFQDFLSAKPHTTAFYLSIYRLQLSILLFLITLHSRRPK